MTVAEKRNKYTSAVFFIITNPQPTIFYLTTSIIDPYGSISEHIREEGFRYSITDRRLSRHSNVLSKAITRTGGSI